MKALIMAALIAVASTIPPAPPAEIPQKEIPQAEATQEEITPTYTGPVLTRELGRIAGPSGQETYYNLDMTGVIEIMRSQGYDYGYWIRGDGVKMFGDFVMVAADLSIRPRGSLVETSLGTGIVCDTGDFIWQDPYQLDIAVAW